MTFQLFLKSKLATWLLTAALVLVGFISIRILVQKRTVDDQIKKLQAEADKISHDNEQLSSLIKYMNTPEYEDAQAREKLNLKKDGEEVVVLPQTDAADASADSPKPVSNPKQWFNYFFKTP